VGRSVKKLIRASMPSSYSLTCVRTAFIAQSKVSQIYPIRSTAVL